MLRQNGSQLPRRYHRLANLMTRPSPCDRAEFLIGLHSIVPGDSLRPLIPLWLGDRRPAL
jgi:hypothetical protein